MKSIWLITIVAVASVHASPPDLSLEFWAGPGAEKDPRISHIKQHHACSGRIATARLARLPTSTTGPLQPDWADELGSDGEVLRRWPMPLESEVVGVDRDSIFVKPYRAPDATALRVEPDGRYKRIPYTDPAARTRVECPASRSRGSAYRRCFKLEDASSGRDRVLTWEGPCT